MNRDGDPEAEPWLADESIRNQLLALCRARKRTVGQPPEHPHRWRPGEVRHPVTREPFDTTSAWYFIEECLSSGVALEVILMDQPAGKKGFVMLVPGHDNRRIYIKLCFGASRVIGRSFHLSDRDVK